MPQANTTASINENAYANAQALTPLQTQEFLVLAVVLFIMGVLLVEGRLLARVYRALARLIGIRAPLRPNPQQPW